MNWAVSNIHYFYYSWEYFLEQQKIIGAKKIDFFSAMPHIWVDHYGFYGCEKIRKSVLEKNMKLILFTPKPYNYCLFAPQEIHSAMSEQYYKNSIQAAKTLGIDRMSISLSGGYRDYPKDALRIQAEKKLACISRFAQQCEVKLLLETGEAEKALFTETEDIKRLICNNNMGILLNIKSVQKSESMIYQWKKEFKEKLEYIRFHNEVDFAQADSLNGKVDWGICISDDTYWDNPMVKDQTFLDKG